VLQQSVCYVSPARAMLLPQGVVMRPFMLVVALLLCPPALADLVTAQIAYQKGDYERAFHDYRELAELGQPTAQLNLAIMYARGEGTRQSDLYAYAWASLAAESGHAGAESLVNSLRSLLAPGSEKIAEDIAAPYRRAALNARLMPSIEDDEGTERQCKFVSFPRVEYPDDANRRGIQGNVAVEFTVMAEGTTRNPRILYAVPAGVFDVTARSAILHTRYPTLAAGVRPIHCRLMFRFAANGQRADDYPKLGPLVETTRKQAQSGDPAAEYLYGMLLAGLPQLGEHQKDALPWFLKSAQSGNRHAQYMVGSSLLSGTGCRCEETKAEVWLRKAAEADEPDAQVTLAQFALRGTPDAVDTGKAKTWLERAVAGGSHDGMLCLSALLAATPFAALRDPPRALSLLDKVRKDLGGDPVEFEIRAAAEAASGAFGKAVDSERHALARAQELHWDLAPLNERLAHYQAGQAWYGNLLAL
jgi:uncharacterized protein